VDVFEYYNDELEEGPWQLASTFSSEEVDTLQFSSVNDADITGIVTVAAGGDNNRTSVLISMQDAGAYREELPPFELGESVPVPNEFPSDIPQYDDGTVTGSAFVREPGNESFLLIFLTEDSRDEVLEFYRTEFQELNWIVQDGTPLGVEERADFHDSEGMIQGDIIVREFERDAKYVEVSVQFRQDPAREEGGAPEATETPPAPTNAPPATVASSGTPAP